MEIAPHISVDPQIHHGAPVIKGDHNEALNAQLDETRTD
jgi:hypothetical protein